MNLATKNRTHSAFRGLLNLLFPQYCKACGDRILTGDNGFFCPMCWDSSPLVQRPFCMKCGKPHVGMAGFGSLSNIVCAECRKNPNPAIDRIYGAALYDGAVKEAIRLFKFGSKLHLLQPLADLLSTLAITEMSGEQYDFIVPVPLHRVRQRARGYNQSLLLAQEITPFFEGAQVDESLKRIRPTRAQSRLKGVDREQNVRGAFAVEGDPYQGKRILLVDDVVTTAVTVTECARALRRAGASKVDVLTVALTAHLFE